MRIDPKYFELFGLKARDVVTGLEGVVESISFDLYGCVQAVIRPPANEKGELVDGRWIDIKRLIAIGKAPVMDLPSFTVASAEHGAAAKPAR